MFTLENTEGFPQEVLEKMNTELADAIAEIDVDAISYADEVQHIEEQIFNKYC